MLSLMTCDHCKNPIQKGEPYSVTALGRLHATCQRTIAKGVIQGPLTAGGYADPVYVLHRA